MTSPDSRTGGTGPPEAPAAERYRRATSDSPGRRAPNSRIARIGNRQLTGEDASDPIMDETDPPGIGRDRPILPHPEQRAAHEPARRSATTDVPQAFGHSAKHLLQGAALRRCVEAPAILPGHQAADRSIARIHAEHAVHFVPVSPMQATVINLPRQVAEHFDHSPANPLRILLEPRRRQAGHGRVIKVVRRRQSVFRMNQRPTPQSCFVPTSTLMTTAIAASLQ